MANRKPEHAAQISNKKKRVIADKRTAFRLKTAVSPPQEIDILCIFME